MALNKNHLFEDINDVRCGIVEKDVTPDRVAFLKELLEFNNYIVVTAPSPPPKTAPAPKPVEASPSAPTEATVELPETFTVGVTDYTFNPINAIFGRMLKTKNGHIVTLAFWEQKETERQDEIPYYENI